MFTPMVYMFIQHPGQLFSEKETATALLKMPVIVTLHLIKIAVELKHFLFQI